MQRDSEITMYPGLDLSSVGKTPTGAPLFRVVLASSRIETVYDSEGTFHRIPVYFHDGWVLEKWLKAEDFAGTPERFAADCKTAGLKKRYPTEGEYDAVHPFKTNDEVQLALLYAQMAQYGWENLTVPDRKKIHDFHIEKRAKDVAQQRRDMIADAAPVGFGYMGGKRTGLVAEQYRIIDPFTGREVIQ